MSQIVLKQFGGMLPRYDEQALPVNGASLARNCRLIAGQLQSLKAPTLVASFANYDAVARAFRVVTGGATDVYACFTDTSVDFVKAPLVNDAYNRHYWTTTENDGYPRYATATMLETDYNAGNVPTGYRLGVPAPWNAPTVVPSATGGTLEETRVYVYTFETAYGEESAPSPPTIVTGNSDAASWDITGLDGLDELESQLGAGTADEYNITTVNIYRTITGTTGSVDYFLVATQAITPLLGGTGTYSDTATTDTVSLNPTLESETWNTPPVDLVGLLVHPNGFLVGFKGRDLYFSVPYRPHAWPVEYILSTKWNIVGLGIIGQSLVVLTEGSPYIASGVRPEAMTFIESDTPDACTSRRGVVSTTRGVLFPGVDGLMMATPDGAVRNISKDVITRREWRTMYRPYQLEAVRHNNQYVAFYSATRGFYIDFDEPTQAFIELDHALWDHSAVLSDPTTGAVWLVRDKSLLVWDPERGSPVPYLWRSREFEIPEATSFGAVQITFSVPSSTGSYTQDQLDSLEAYNDERITYPLNPLNFSVMNGVEVLDLTSTVDQTRQDLHAGPLYTLVFGDAEAGLTFRIYVNRETDPVYEQEITDMDMYRPPTGFRAVLWVFELEGTADVQVLRIASTAKELTAV